MCGFDIWMHCIAPFSLQEVTLDGGYVRSLGKPAITGDVLGVAASADMIAVSLQDSAHQILLLDCITGDLIRSFGEDGRAEGYLTGNFGTRFTPDGGHILIAETGNCRLSLFTLSGEFVRCVGVGVVDGPFDCDFASNGDIVVSDWDTCSVYVFSPDGALLRSFGSCGDDEPSVSQQPYALASHGDALYVLDYDSVRLQVFK